MTNNEESEIPDPFDPEARPRGILTKKDRRFLVNQREYPPHKHSDRRYRIRERVKNSFYDFPFLKMLLPDEDRESIFADVIAEEKGFRLIPNALGFLYAGLQDIEEDFESTLARAINSYEQREHPDEIARVEVNIEIEREQPSIDEVIYRFISGDATMDDFNFIMRNQDKNAPTRLIERLEEEDRDLQLIEPESEERHQMTLDMFREIVQPLEEAEDKGG